MATANLSRSLLVKNPKYTRNGFKSYVYLLQKYNFMPTKDGPYYVENSMQSQGKFGPGKAVGGRTKIMHQLKKKVMGSSDAAAPAADPPASSSAQAGTVDASDVQNDSEYLCPVTIGTPGQTLHLDFDTGSADLWVWSTELPSATQSSGSSHTIYDPSSSSTYQAASGSTWQIQYGDGSSASGTVGTDNVTIGGLTITNQAVELSNTLSAEFASGAGDGLLGLAWGSINTVKPSPVQTPVENMISQGDIPKTSELFTAYLTNAKTSETPFYTFGFIDPDVLTAAGVSDPSTIHYTPVDNSQGFWMFSSTSASVNGTAIQQSGNTAIADTGTTLALVSDAVCEAIYKAIPGATYNSQQQGYVIPSTVDVSSLPTVEIDVGGQLFQIQKEDLLFADAGNGLTYGGIQSRGTMTFDILGDTFLKGIYAIFDQGNTRFGAVQRTAPAATGTTA